MGHGKEKIKIGKRTKVWKILKNLQETDKIAKGCGKINTSNTTGIGMGREGHSNIFKDRKRNNRLEWRC